MAVPAKALIPANGPGPNGRARHTFPASDPSALVFSSLSTEMTYRVITRDGTTFFVPEVDLALITAYLVLQGYPPVSVEVAESAPQCLNDEIREPRT